MSAMESLVLSILRRARREPLVSEWPFDEASAYADAGGFYEGSEAVDNVRLRKIMAAIRAEKEQVWNEVLDEIDAYELNTRQARLCNPYREGP